MSSSIILSEYYTFYHRAQSTILLFNFTSELFRGLEDFRSTSSRLSSETWPYISSQRKRTVDWDKICQQIFPTDADDSKSDQLRKKPISLGPHQHDELGYVEMGHVDSLDVVGTCRNVLLMTFTARRKECSPKSKPSKSSSLRFTPHVMSLFPWMEAVGTLALNRPLVASCPNSVFISASDQSGRIDTPNTSEHIMGRFSTVCAVCYHSVATLWLIQNCSRVSDGPKIGTPNGTVSETIDKPAQMGVRVFCVGSVQLPASSEEKCSLGQVDLITSVAVSHLSKGTETQSPSTAGFFEFCLYLGTGTGRMFSYRLRLSDSEFFFSELPSRPRVFHLGVIDVDLLVGGTQSSCPITSIECSPKLPGWLFRSLTPASSDVSWDRYWWTVAYSQERHVGAVLASLNRTPVNGTLPALGLRHWNSCSDIQHQQPVVGVQCLITSSLVTREIPENELSDQICQEPLSIANVYSVDSGGHLIIQNLSIEMMDGIIKLRIDLASHLICNARNDQTGMASFCGIVDRLSNTEHLNSSINGNHLFCLLKI